MSAEKVVTDEVRGDGGEQKVTDDFLKELKNQVNEIAQEMDKGLNGVMVDSANTRFCKWDGQSDDGLKHAAANDGEEVEPFEGACDGRYRIADMLVNEDVMLCVVALMRARIRIKPTEASDIAYAGNLDLLLRWLKRNHFGFEYIREQIKLANYLFGDSPAVALMGVYWERNVELKMQTMNVDQLAQLYMEQAVQRLVDQGEALDEARIREEIETATQGFLEAMTDPLWGTDELVILLQQFFPSIRETRARKVIEELKATGFAQFPVPIEISSGPKLRAKRIYHDWYIPMNTTEFQRAQMYFEVEWLSKVEVNEHAITNGWSAAFVKEVIGDGVKKGHEGAGSFKEFERDADGELRERTYISHKGLYEIITAHFQAVNEDGVPGRYFITFHMNVDITATPRKLLPYKHGKYAGHAFQRESLSERLIDSRGIPELVSSHQNKIKLFHDSAGDNATVSALPPIITEGRQGLGKLYIMPLVEVQTRRAGDVKWMQPPAYPVMVEKMEKELRRQVDEYHGRENEEIPPAITQLQKEFKVMWWLANQCEVDKQTIQLCQQYMTDDQVKRITNSKSISLLKSREDIQGEFDIEMTFDPKDMDPEYLSTLAAIMKDLLMAMDRDKTINPSPLVSALFWRLAPDLAEESIRPVDEAILAETEDEIRNYQKVRAGIEPDMITDGSQNYALRFNLYDQMQQMNPQVYNDMSEDKRVILQTRLQHLQVMMEQFGENPEIGRAGAKRATGPGGELEAEAAISK